MFGIVAPASDGKSASRQADEVDARASVSNVSSRRAAEFAFRAAAIVLSLLALEAGLRLLGLPAADACWVPKEAFWIPDDQLGFAYRPGARVAGGIINEIGLRGPVPDAAGSAGKPRMLFLGDSSAYGFGVADEESFWSLASRALDAEPIVAAAPGYSTYHSRVLLERLLPTRPEWVVFYVGAYNDHRRRVYYADAEIPERMARRHAGWHRIRTLAAGELVFDKLGRWLRRQSHDPLAMVRVSPAAFETNLRAMLAATRAAGVRSLVLIPPFSNELRARRQSISQYEQILRRVAGEAADRVVELGPDFDAASGVPLFQRDGIHPTVAGQARIAAAIEREIRAAGGFADQRASASQ